MYMYVFSLSLSVAHSLAHSFALARACCRFLFLFLALCVSLLVYVASFHTRDFAATHLKTRRFAQPGSFGPRTATSYRLVASVQPPTRLFCAPPRPFRDFDNLFSTSWIWL